MVTSQSLSEPSATGCVLDGGARRRASNPGRPHLVVQGCKHSHMGMKVQVFGSCSVSRDGALTCGMVCGCAIWPGCASLCSGPGNGARTELLMPLAGARLVKGHEDSNRRHRHCRGNRSLCASGGPWCYQASSLVFIRTFSSSPLFWSQLSVTLLGHLMREGCVCVHFL